MAETNDTAAIEPPWWSPAKGRARARQPLSRDAIVDAAIKILDAEGVDALTIRRLADELGTGPATLYWHINGKEELGELVYDRIMGDLKLPEPDPSRWQEQLKDMARQAYRILRSHNDAVRLSLGRIPVGPNMLRVMDWSLGLLRSAGISEQVAGYVGDLFGRYLDASVLEVASGPFAREDTADAAVAMVQGYFSGLPAERFPNLTAMSGTMFDMDDEDRFELGLEILMRGIETYARPKKTGATRRASGPGASRRR